MSTDTAPGPGAPADDAPAIADRITVALIPQAATALADLQERTRLSKTDLANRAITLYDFADKQTRDGQELLIRDKETGDTQLVVFL